MVNSIVLIGFMGAGKDTIGKMLALKTGLGFLSTDEFIEISESRSISDIFRIKGEDYFRRKETSVLKAIQRLPNLIIATGGGMVMLEKNRRIMKKIGAIIHLDAGMSVLLARTRIDRQRPLAKNRKYLKKLFRRRRDLYDFCNYRIDTENRTPTEIANILMKKLNLKNYQRRSNIQRHIIKTDRKKYPVLIGNNILVPALKTVLESKKIAIISNPLVSSLYRSKLVKALKKRHSDIHEFILPDGEKYKNVNSALKTYSYLLKNTFDRSDMVIALGGGVISDLAGFAASTYKRGIKYVIIPTTLMGQVDAAIGGKTGIDMMVKNSIGTFYQPDLVIIDIDFIKTLSRQHFISGFAEVIKYGAIRDSALFLLLEEKIDLIKKRDPGILKEIITRCIEIKSKVVARDEREQTGHRLILNFGHTIGHAIECLSQYNIDHGAAVAIGMVLEAGIANKLGFLTGHEQQRLKDLISNFGLPVQLPQNIKGTGINECIRQDKKQRNSQIQLPLLIGIGKTKIKEVKWKKLL